MRVVLGMSCPGYELSWVRVVHNPCDMSAGCVRSIDRHLRLLVEKTIPDESYTSQLGRSIYYIKVGCIPHSKVHGANTGPTWVLWAPDGPHVGPMNLVIWDYYSLNSPFYVCLSDIRILAVVTDIENIRAEWVAWIEWDGLLLWRTRRLNNLGCVSIVAILWQNVTIWWFRYLISNLSYKLQSCLLSCASLITDSANHTNKYVCVDITYLVKNHNIYPYYPEFWMLRSIMHIITMMSQWARWCLESPA